MPTTDLDGVIVHVGFAHNRGDVLDYVEYKGKKYEPDEASEVILPKLWGDSSKRADVAWAWVTQVLMVGNTLLEERPDDFVDGKVAFDTPKVNSYEDGRVEVVLWYRDPVGMLPVTSYSKRSYKFSPDGALSVEALEDLSFPIE